MNLPREPLPTLGRMMAFIDGENLVCRYQAMLVLGRLPTDEVKHRRDIYAWGVGTIHPGLNVVLRATYYTYAFGGHNVDQEIAREIQSLSFTQYNPIGHPIGSRLGNSLYPKVFTKPKDRSGKGVDIQMTVDALSNTYQNNLDVVYLVSGDGDYEPLISECQRQGKLVFVAALSNGLNPRLPLIADRFINLDNYYFRELPLAPNDA